MRSTRRIAGPLCREIRRWCIRHGIHHRHGQSENPYCVRLPSWPTEVRSSGAISWSFKDGRDPSQSLESLSSGRFAKRSPVLHPETFQNGFHARGDARVVESLLQNECLTVVPVVV